MCNLAKFQYYFHFKFFWYNIFHHTLCKCDSLTFFFFMNIELPFDKFTCVVNAANQHNCLKGLTVGIMRLTNYLQ